MRKVWRGISSIIIIIEKWKEWDDKKKNKIKDSDYDQNNNKMIRKRRIIMKVIKWKDLKN